MVTVKVYATSEEDVNILKKGVTVSSLRGHRPDAIVPTGLDPARQWYLYEQLDLSVQQTKQRTLPVHYLQSPNPNNKTYFELTALHLILCITSLPIHLVSMWLLQWTFFGNKNSESTFFQSGLVLIEPSILPKKLFFKFHEITPLLHARSHMYVGLSMGNPYKKYVCQKCVGGITWPEHPHAQSQFWAV